MAVNKITEKTAATSVKDNASILITQPETVGNANVETLERAAFADVANKVAAGSVNDGLIATFKAAGAGNVVDGLSISSGGVSPTAGTNNTGSDLCRLGYTEYTGPLLLMIDSSDYEWNVWAYTNKGTSYKIKSLTNKGYATGPVVLPAVTGSHPCFRIGFRRLDGTTVTEEMMTALAGKISFYKLTDATLAVSGAAADAKTAGDRLTTDETAITGLGTRATALEGRATALESFRTNQLAYDKRDRFRLIQWKKNTSPNATGAVSSMTVIGGWLYVWKYTANNEDVSDNKAYPINADGTVDFANGVTFTSNLGHANTVGWNEKNGCLLAARTPAGNDTNDNKRTIIIIPGVTNATTSFDRTASGSVNIDLDMSIEVGGEKAFGEYRLNTVWGPNTVLETGSGGSGTAHSDLIYVVSDDSSSNASGKRRLALLQLAKGSNTEGFSHGTAATVGDTAYNGKYNVLQVWTQEWSAVNGIAQGNNDAMYYGGKIYEMAAPVSTAGFPLMIHSFDDFGLSWKTERIMIPTRGLSGAATAWEKGGVAIYNGHLYTSAKSAGVFVFEF